MSGRFSFFFALLYLFTSYVLLLVKLRQDVLNDSLIELDFNFDSLVKLNIEEIVMIRKLCER